MKLPLRWHDQTLNEGMRLGISGQQLVRLANTLLAAGADTLDVDWPNWQDYEHILSRYEAKAKLRLRLDNNDFSCWDELAAGGIRQVIITLGDIDEASSMIANIKRYGLAVTIELEHSFIISGKKRTELLKNMASLKSLVASLIIKDTDSILRPLQVYSLLQELGKSFAGQCEFHPHNEYGMATANCVAAVKAGATSICAAAGGVGSQGHAAWEEVCLAVKHTMGVDVEYRPVAAEDYCHMFNCLGIEPPKHKAIVGTEIFYHESGLHADGVLKKPQLYEAFSPDEVGLCRKLVLGKHSGSAAVAAKLKEHNIAAGTDVIEQVLAIVRSVAVRSDGNVSDNQLVSIFRQVAGQKASRERSGCYEAETG